MATPEAILAAPAQAIDASAARVDREIDLECIRTLYRQIPNSFAAALVVTLYLIVTLWQLSPHAWLMAWLAGQFVAQLIRAGVYRAYRRADRRGAVDVDSAARWGRRYAGYMALAGGVWATAAALFVHPGEPLTVAFTLCGLYGITGGAVPGNAYFRPAVMWFIWPVFATVLLRLAVTGRVDFIALGLASVAFAGILSLFCRVQHASIREALRVRFENRELLIQLAHQKNEAESARHQAEQASLAKSQFLAAASHDLRQPLHALGLFSASLDGLTLDAPARRAVHSIQANIDALEDLFDALLDVSRLDAGVVVAQLADIAVEPLLRSVAHGLQPLAQAKGLRLRVAATTAWVRADPVLLRRVMGNLAANALRYTNTGGVLMAARRAHGDLIDLSGNGDGNGGGRDSSNSAAGWRLECRDSGTGIAEADQRRIFEEFVQLHNPERNRRHGLGLGLAIAQRCAVLLGASIRVRSRVGQGSVFSMTLPAIPAGVSPPPVADADAGGAAPFGERAGDPLAGKRLLVVDDEASIREGLVLLLSQWGCSVVAVADHAAALAAFDDRIDLVLADLRLPDGHSGLRTLQELRARRATPLPVCLITGESDPQALRDGRDSQIPLLHKPVRAAQLRATLLHLLST